jgi:NitT/TauT family transport system substrate-binding protein
MLGSLVNPWFPRRADRFRRPAWMLLACLALLAAGCNDSHTSPSPVGATPGLNARTTVARPGTSVTLRLGYFLNITHATAIVGVASGIFGRNLGANVKLTTATFNAGPAAVEALFSGALDASYMGPNPAINAYVRSRGEAVRIVSGATSGGASLIVRPEINAPADLRGKKVASPQLGNTQDVALRSWLQSQGLKSDAQGGGDVSVTPQENADTLVAFKSGQIAGAWVPEPWSARLVVEGGGKVLVDERDLWPGGQFPTTVLVVRTDYLQRHPDVVAGLLRGQVEANSFVNAQPAEAQRLLSGALERLTGQALRRDVITAGWQHMTFSNDPLVGSLKQSASAAAALGFLKLDGADIARISDLRPLNTALQASGSTEVQSK